MEDKHKILEKVKKLYSDFKNTLDTAPSSISEEKIRSGFLNKLFEIFEWNLSDITEVIEEKTLKGLAKENLKSIGSDNKRPDYILCENGVHKMIVDAKNITEDFKKSKSYAFQIRSYSWSSNLPIAMISNFQEFGIYDTTFIPDANQDPEYRAIFFTIQDLIEEFDTYSTFFNKQHIQNHSWNLSSELDIDLHNSKNKSLDEAFFELLENFRLDLGQSIFENMPKITQDRLNYYTQIIINRILFIRFLEDLNIETEGTLQSYLNTDNFWDSFVKKSLSEFKTKYDGALFDIDLPKLSLENKVFKEFISSITGTSPYRFDIIKPSFIAEIYDQFLGRQLFISNSTISINNKPLSPEGAVPTPYELSHYICQHTIQLDNLYSIDELLELNILDPCVGSGSFLLSALDVLVEKYKTLEHSTTISFSAVKDIIKHCLYGVDIDTTALEVLKMTLSLKIVTSNYILPEPFEKILSDIDKNFLYGNTIVQEDASMLESEEFEQSPTDFEKLFPKVFENGGFDYLITNPPYVEPKHFKKRWPITHGYLKKKYKLSDKVDVSMFFLKRIDSLINKKGRYGLVIQKRFFKTEYGKKVRNYLSETEQLTSIHDFEDNYIFKGKTTYVACLFGKKSSFKDTGTGQIQYVKHIEKLNDTRTNLKEVINTEADSIIIDTNILKDRNWSYESLSFANSLENKLVHTSELTTLDNIHRLNIGVGPQVLDSQFYFLRNVEEINEDIITAFNRRNEEVIIEKELIRPVLRNDRPEKYNLTQEAKDYIVFPYNEDGNLLSISELVDKYPKGYAYLSFMANNSDVEKVDNANEFYRYTRETKLNSYNRPKIFIPMTVKNVSASLVEKDMFGDNSNINTILDRDDDIDFLKAMCVIFNSNLFNKLAIILSGEAGNGYRKLNKQFLKLVPVPILDNETQNSLLGIFEEITKLKQYINYSSGEKQNNYKKKLESTINQANKLVNSLYDFSEKEMQNINNLSERT